MEVGSIEYIATINTSDYKRGSQTIQNENAKMEGSTEKTSSRMTGALGKVGKVGFAALATASVAATAVVVKNIDNAVKRIDTLVAFPRVLQAMGVGADEAEAATKKLSERLLDLPTPLQDGAAGVYELVAAGLGIEEATDTFLAFNNATLAASTETAKAQGAFTQLTDAISRGKIEGEEWSSIVTAMPTALLALSNESGKSREELRQLYRESPEQLLKDLVRLDKEGGGGLASLEEQARAATGGIGTAFSNMGNAVTRGIESIVRSIGDGGTDQEKLESGQRKISNAITATGVAFEVALSGIGRGAVNVTKFLWDMRVPILAVTAAFAAYQATAIATNAVVTIQRMLFAATQTQLLLMNGTLVAVRASTVAQTIAQTALNTVMKMNPIGLVVGAIGGLVTAYSLATSQTNNSKDATERLDTARKNAKLSADALKLATNNLRGAELNLEGSEIAVARARERLTALQRSGKASSLDIREAELNLAQAEDSLKSAKEGVRTATKEKMDKEKEDAERKEAVRKAEEAKRLAFLRTHGQIQRNRDMLGGLSLQLDNLNGRKVGYTIVTRYSGEGEAVPGAGKGFGVLKSRPRYAGGPVSAGRAYLVGENRDGSINDTTELFVPNSSGRIINSKDLQSALSSAGGGGTTGNSVTVGTIIIEKDVDVDLVARKLGISQLQTRRGIA